MVTNQNQRMDAKRNREAIIDSALHLLQENPQATMAEIAAAAKVGRVTLYGHFCSREVLIEAAFEEAMARTAKFVSQLPKNDDPQQTLNILIESSWQQLDQNYSMLTAAKQALGEREVSAKHNLIHDHILGQIAGGQAAGAFRNDLSPEWLTAMFSATLHAAAEEISAGRVSEKEASKNLEKTLTRMLIR